MGGAIGGDYIDYRAQPVPQNQLVQFERAQNSDTSGTRKFYRLAYLAQSAFDAGDLEKASHCANDLLREAPQCPKGWNYGNAIYHGNNVVGRIAIKLVTIEQEKKYLLKTGKTPGPPRLNSFGPNITLAEELLEKGGQDAVLQYFDMCRIL